jgi:hypothetical protein
MLNLKMWYQLKNKPSSWWIWWTRMWLMLTGSTLMTESYKLWTELWSWLVGKSKRRSMLLKRAIRSGSNCRNSRCIRGRCLPSTDTKYRSRPFIYIFSKKTFLVRAVFFVNYILIILRIKSCLKFID